jgi:hypothetical protein
MTPFETFADWRLGGKTGSNLTPLLVLREDGGLASPTTTRTE